MPVQRLDREAVQLGEDDVEACGAFAVERLAQVEQGQLQFVARLREGHAVVGGECFAFIDGRFGLFALGSQPPAAFGLEGAQFELPPGDADQLLVVEHLEVKRHDVDRHVLADAFEVLHGGREV